ncbi:MAG: amidase family protein, partial [Nitriliruptorales bacterium]|nr:amidase family protein [Nitriliruptorales bacterium]
VVTELQGEGYEPGVETAFEAGLHRLEALGAEIVEVSLPHAPYGLPAYYLVAPSEASSNLARYDGTLFGKRVDAATTEEMNALTRAQGFGPEVQRRVMIGTYALSAGYFDAAFEQAEVLVSPTSPSVAFPFDSKTNDPIAMYLNDIATVPASLAGVPALSVPCGTDEEGLPVGIQFMGPLLAEDLLLRVAWAFEQEVGFDPIPRGDNAAPAPEGS